MKTRTNRPLRAVGWGVAVMVLAVGVSGTTGRGATPADPPGVVIEGRTVDERGTAVGGADVRIYRRGGMWSRRDPEVARARATQDGRFRLTLPGPPIDQPAGSSLVLVADRPGLAVGWKVAAAGATPGGDVVLSATAEERTILVTGPDGRPMAGALVAVSGLGDPTAAAPHLRDFFQLRPTDGPLATTTDEAGRARFPHLPRTKASFEATKPGFATTPCFSGQDSVRLTPDAALGGVLIAPDGSPARNVRLRLKTGFMWDFEEVRTDDRGNYRFDGLKARGWDMAAWRPGQVGDGTYQLWLEDKSLAIPTQKFVLEPGERRILDLRAVPAGRLLVAVLEEGTKKRVAGVSIDGFDADDRRFSATTDAEGLATFYSGPARISLGVNSTPANIFFDKDLRNYADAHDTFDFQGGAEEMALFVPPIGGRRVALGGRCVGPDGGPARGLVVHAAPGAPVGYLPPGPADASGRFELKGLPAGHPLGLLAVDPEGRVGGWLATRLDADGRPDRAAVVAVRPAVEVEVTLRDGAGRPLAGSDFMITPRVVAKFGWQGRYLRTDGDGRALVARVVPGLAYEVELIPQGRAYQVEKAPERPGAAGDRPRRVAANLGGITILAPGD